MSEIRFTCPSCVQQLACDDAWCGNEIACPGCGQRIEVPHFLAFTEGATGSPAAAVPAATQRRPRPPSGGTDAYAKAAGVYTESEWERHAEEVTGQRDIPPWLLAILLLGPFPFAIFLATRLRLPGAVMACFVLFALVSGVALALRSRHTGWRFLAWGVASSICMFFVYGALAVGVLFAGCIFLG